MTKEDIKKALKCCETDFCCRCPYYEYRGCETTLKRYALTLITEQEKEIERLKAEFKQLETNAEILARGVRDLNRENYELTEKVKQSQIDVLNRLKRIMTAYSWQIGINDVQKEIDKLIKEVENETINNNVG